MEEVYLDTGDRWECFTDRGFPSCVFPILFTQRVARSLVIVDETDIFESCK